MRYQKFLILALLFSWLLTGCHSHDHPEEAAQTEAPTVSVTLYTKATELFLEYPQLVAGEEAKFLVHLTDLKDFKPVTTGKLVMTFTHQSGEKVTVTEEKPARAGIFTPTVKIGKTGKYKLEMNLTGSQVNDLITVDEVVVFASKKEFPPEKEENAALVSFLKEQQWKIDYATEPVATQMMQSSIISTGEFIAKPESFSKVISPLTGIILVKKNANFPKIGAFVKKGATLLHISPTSDAGLNLQKIKSDYLLAGQELERVKLLYEKNAVSKKRLEEATSDYDTKSAVYNALLDQVKLTENGFSILAPIDGYVESVFVSLGSHVTSGQELLSIINPARIVLKANVPAAKYEAADKAVDASFIIEGQDEELVLSKLRGKKVAISSSVNPANRTVPVYFEFDNPKRSIKIGMYAEVFIKTGKPEETMAIPESAIVDEDGNSTVYVLVGGESFEKRIVKTGVKDNGFVQILSGLKEGERIVTKGAYQVRLAALAPESAIGHGHTH